MSAASVLDLRFGQHSIAKVAGELVWRAQVDAPAKELRKLDLHRCETHEPDPHAWFELHEEIDVTAGPVIAMQDGTK
jgi:hypothetical protein